MTKITAKHPSWMGLQLTINGKPMTVGEGLTLESIPKDVQAKVDTYVRMGVITVEKSKVKDSYEKPIEDPKDEDPKFKKGGK